MSAPIIIDIGSMDGREIIWAIEHGYEVHAFEPNLNMRKYLEPLQESAIIHYAAAWNEDGMAPLYPMFNPEPGEDGISLIKEKENVGDIGIDVPTINMGKYLEKLDKDIDILKINAEGAEYIIIESILNNFEPKRIRHWLVEDHSNYIADQGWRDKREQILKRLDYLGIELENYRGVESLINTQ